jgi:hypothetical protein
MWAVIKKSCHIVKPKESSFPAKPAVVAAYMKRLLAQGKSRTTINATTVSAINDAYKFSPYESPTKSPLVEATAKVITALTKAPVGKRPLKRAHLAAIAETVTVSNFVQVRNFLMILLMWTGM